MNLKRIRERKNIDATTVLRGQPSMVAGKLQGDFIIEVTMTDFVAATESTGASVQKKITVYGTGKSLDAAQENALDKAAELLGL